MAVQHLDDPFYEHLHIDQLKISTLSCNLHKFGDEVDLFKCGVYVDRKAEGLSHDWMSGKCMPGSDRANTADGWGVALCSGVYGSLIWSGRIVRCA